jgi:hypothetical protein
MRNLAVTQLRLELANGLRAARKSELAWLGLGGGGLLAYGAVAIAQTVVRWAGVGAPPQVSMLVMAVAMMALGAVVGARLGGLTSARAFAPFLAALPISLATRRRMAAEAALLLTVPLTVLLALCAGLCCLLIRAAPFVGDCRSRSFRACGRCRHPLAPARLRTHCCRATAFQHLAQPTDGQAG